MPRQNRMNRIIPKLPYATILLKSCAMDVHHKARLTFLPQKAEQLPCVIFSTAYSRTACLNVATK